MLASRPENGTLIFLLPKKWSSYLKAGLPQEVGECPQYSVSAPVVKWDAYRRGSSCCIPWHRVYSSSLLRVTSATTSLCGTIVLDSSDP